MTFEILRYNIYVKSNDAILRSDFMATVINNPVMERENIDAIKLELYRLIGEGYKAMQEGMVSSIDDVCERIKRGEQNVTKVVFKQPAEHNGTE